MTVVNSIYKLYDFLTEGGERKEAYKYHLHWSDVFKVIKESSPTSVRNLAYTRWRIKNREDEKLKLLVTSWNTCSAFQRDMFNNHLEEMYSV